MFKMLSQKLKYMNVGNIFLCTQSIIININNFDHNDHNAMFLRTLGH